MHLHLQQNGQQRMPFDISGVRQSSSLIDQSVMFQDIFQNVQNVQSARTNPHHGGIGPLHWPHGVERFTGNFVGQPGYLNMPGFLTIPNRGTRGAPNSASSSTYLNSIGFPLSNSPMYNRSRSGGGTNIDGGQVNFSNLSDNVSIQANLSRSTLELMSSTLTKGGGAAAVRKPVQWGVKTPAAMSERAPTSGSTSSCQGQNSHQASAVGDRIAVSTNGHYFSDSAFLPDAKHKPFVSQDGYFQRLPNANGMLPGIQLANGFPVAGGAQNQSVQNLANSNRYQLNTPNHLRRDDSNAWRFHDSSRQVLNNLGQVSNLGQNSNLGQVSVEHVQHQQKYLAVNSVGRTVNVAPPPTSSDNSYLGLLGGANGFLDNSVGFGYGKSMTGISAPWPNNVQVPRGPVQVAAAAFNPNIALPASYNNSMDLRLPFGTRFPSVMQQRQAMGYVPPGPLQNNQGLIRSAFHLTAGERFPSVQQPMGLNLSSDGMSWIPDLSPMGAAGNSTQVGLHQILSNHLGFQPPLVPGASNDTLLAMINTNNEMISGHQPAGMVGSYPLAGAGVHGQLAPGMVNCNQPPGMMSTYQPSHVRISNQHSSSGLSPSIQPPPPGVNNVAFKTRGTTSNVDTTGSSSSHMQNNSHVVEWLKKSADAHSGDSAHRVSPRQPSSGCTLCGSETGCLHSEEFTKTFSDLCGSLVEQLLDKSGVNQTNHVRHASVVDSVATRLLIDQSPSVSSGLSAQTGQSATLQFSSYKMSQKKKLSSSKTSHSRKVTSSSKGKDNSVGKIPGKRLLSTKSTTGGNSCGEGQTVLSGKDISMLRVKTLAALGRTPDTTHNRQESDPSSRLPDSEDLLHRRSVVDGIHSPSLQAGSSHVSRIGSKRKPTAWLKSMSELKTSSENTVNIANNNHSTPRSGDAVLTGLPNPDTNNASKKLRTDGVAGKDLNKNRVADRLSNEAPPKGPTFVRKTCENYSFYNSRKTPMKISAIPPIVRSEITIEEDNVSKCAIAKVDKHTTLHNEKLSTKYSDSTSRTKLIVDTIGHDDRMTIGNNEDDDVLMNSNDCGSSNVDSLMDLFPEFSDMESTTGVGDHLDRDTCLRSMAESTTDPPCESTTLLGGDRRNFDNRPPIASASHNAADFVRARYKSVGKSPENSGTRGGHRYKSVGKSPRFVQRVSVKRKRRRKINSLSGGSADDSADSWYIPEDDVDTPPSPKEDVTRRRRRQSSSTSSWASDDSVTIGKNRRKKRRKLSDEDEEEGVLASWEYRRKRRRRTKRAQRVSNDLWMVQQLAVLDIPDCSVSLERLFLHQRRTVDVHDVGRYLCCPPKRSAASHRAVFDSDDDESPVNGYRAVKKVSRIVYYSDDDDGETTQDEDVTQPHNCPSIPLDTDNTVEISDEPRRGEECLSTPCVSDPTPDDEGPSTESLTTVPC